MESKSRDVDSFSIVTVLLLQSHGIVTWAAYTTDNTSGQVAREKEKSYGNFKSGASV